MVKPWISKEILRKCNERDSILQCISKEMDPAKKLLYKMIIRSWEMKLRRIKETVKSLIIPPILKKTSRNLQESGKA